MQLLDLSSNGTYVNAKIVGKSKLHTLVSGDEISLLNPNPSSHPAGGCVKPTHYHYLYQDLRPPQQPTPPKRQPRLLQVRAKSGIDLLLIRDAPRACVRPDSTHTFTPYMTGRTRVFISAINVPQRRTMRRWSGLAVVPLPRSTRYDMS